MAQSIHQAKARDDVVSPDEEELCDSPTDAAQPRRGFVVGFSPFFFAIEMHF
jgi:hypothetical protein